MHSSTIQNGRDNLIKAAFVFFKGIEMITFNEMLQHLKQGKTVELKFNLNFGVYSRHRLRLRRGIIVDHSFVDNSVTRTSAKAYRRGFYGKAFNKHAIELLKETVHDSN